MALFSQQSNPIKRLEKTVGAKLLCLKLVDWTIYQMQMLCAQKTKSTFRFVLFECDGIVAAAASTADIVNTAARYDNINKFESINIQCRHIG